MILSEELLWRCRAIIYRHIAATGVAPTALEVATRCAISADLATAVIQRLHERHALFLDPVTATIRMANPFSAIATSFEVHAKGRSYWANCAWDALGIPAALHSDARIETVYSHTAERITLAVIDGRVTDSPAVVHFPLPFRRWYDDLILT